MKKEIMTGIKKAAVGAATVVLVGANAMPVFAADNATLYAYNSSTGAYVSSAHANNCLKTVTNNGDGTYNLVFEVIEYSGVTGYITEFQGEEVEYDTYTLGSESAAITINGTKDTDINGDGAYDAIGASFTVAMGSSGRTHTYDKAALVVNE